MYNIDQPLWCRCDATSTLWYALKARLLVSFCIIRTNVVYNRSEHVITLISYMFCVLKEACRINLRHWGMLPTQLWRQRLGMGGGRKPQAHPCKHQSCENVLICSTGCHEVFSMDVEFQPRPREQIHQAWKVVSGKGLSKFHQRRLWTLPCNEPCLGWLIFQCLSTKVIFPGPAEGWRDYKGINMYEKSSIIRAKACQNVAILCNPEWYSKGVLSNRGRITGLSNLTSSYKIFNVDSFSTFTDLQVPGKRDQKRKPFRSCHLLGIQAKLAQAAALPTAGVASNSFTMVFRRFQIILALTTNRAMENPWFNCLRVKMHKLGGLLFANAMPPMYICAVEVCVCEFIIWLGPKCYWLRSRVSSLAQVLTRFFLIQSDKSGTCPIMIEYHQSLCDESVFNPAKWLWLQGTPKTNGSSLFSALCRFE